MPVGLAEFFKTGGPFMFVNLFMLVISLGIIIERAVALTFRLNIASKSFMSQIEKLVVGNNVDRAVELCSKETTAILPRVIKVGLARAGHGEREVSRALEEAVIGSTPLLSKRIPALWSLANVATLIGLIGTIVGLISTFKSLGAVSPEMKQVLLSKGISEAMNNTAFGLIIAVTCIIGHLVLMSKSKAMIEDVEFQALRLENLLALHGPAAASSKK